MAKRAAKFIDQRGHISAALRRDTEPAIEALVRDTAQARQEGSQTVPERDHQWERATLEHRIGVKVPPDARTLCWLVECAAHLMNRCDIGSDGKTRLHRLHARRDSTPILDFGGVHACQTSKRRKVGPAILSWSIRWIAELVIGSIGCHRAMVGDQNTCDGRQDNS